MGAIADLPVVAYRLSVAGEDPDYLESVGYDQPCGERRMPTLDSQHNADRAMLTAAAPAAADFFRDAN